MAFKKSKPRRNSLTSQTSEATRNSRRSSNSSSRERQSMKQSSSVSTEEQAQLPDRTKGRVIIMTCAMVLMTLLNSSMNITEATSNTAARHQPSLRAFKPTISTPSEATIETEEDEPPYMRMLRSIDEDTQNTAAASIETAPPAVPAEMSIKTDRPTTFLMGIFTTKKERERRELIRYSMLGYAQHKKICSLQDFTTKRAQNQDCELIYTFVLGNNDEGPTAHRTDSGLPIVVDPSTVEDAEPDVVYLNIKENMEDGKSPTWFKYASTLTAQHGIDYVAKTDSDTLMSVPSLVRFIETDLPRTPDGPISNDHRKMYGGLMVDNNLCGGNNKKICRDLYGKVYMAGQFYFVSSDMARYVSSDDLDRSKMTVGVEDYDFGIWVLSHPEPVKLVVLNGNVFWQHNKQTKTDEGWKRSIDGKMEPRRPRYWPENMQKENNEQQKI